ncbi:MAG: TolC family protein [Thermodesulfobacteriota bacterium]
MNTRTNRRRSVALLLIGLAMTGQAWAAEPLALTEALAIARANHPQVEEAAAGLAAAEAKQGQAMAGFLPKVDLSADWSRGESYFTVLGAIKETELATTALTVRQTLLDFGRTGGAYAAARGGRQAAEQTVAASRQDVTLRLKSAWYLLGSTGQLVAASRKTVEAREALFRQASEFFSHGVRSRVEKSRAEANLLAAKSLLLRAENNHELARLELANAMGLPALPDRELVWDEGGGEAGIGGDVAALREEAMAARPEMKRLAGLAEAAAGGLRAARGGYLPTVSGIASVGEAAKSVLPEESVWTVGVTVNLPLFSGFSTREQVREAEAGQRAVAAQHKNLRLQVAREVDAAWLASREAEARVAASQQEFVAARDGEALAMARYREGVGSLVEAIDAQAQAMNAESALIQARYDGKIAMARLERALGRE